MITIICFALGLMCTGTANGASPTPGGLNPCPVGAPCSPWTLAGTPKPTPDRKPAESKSR
jgi:hypothetical protein